MPFGDNSVLSQIAEEMLCVMELEEILDINDLTQEDALEILIAGGHVDYTLFQRPEEEES